MSSPGAMDARTTDPPWWPAAGVALMCTALLVALVAVTASAHGAPVGVDWAMHDWALGSRPPWAVHVAVGVTVAGSGVPAYALAALAGAWAFGPGRWRGALFGTLALVSAQLPRILLAELVARPRPPARDWAWSASGYAMPSGHTTTSMAVAVLLTVAVRRGAPGRWRPVLSAVPVVWAVAVGLSRVCLGMHWPTDVLAGWLLAAAWAGLAGVFLVLCRRREAGAIQASEGDST
ncbi:phosphatase PAP2 family protein [Streptomyces pseudogriseolus]|uniref:phosphatase PAP2 family protein n=1 Tax=Streptomyces pseudogriseolus TaxID=36817 RepID=UPI000A3A114D